MKSWKRDIRVIVANYRENYCPIRRYSSSKSNSFIQIGFTISSIDHILFRESRQFPKFYESQ
jgi:hypothetical protein